MVWMMKTERSLRSFWRDFKMLVYGLYGLTEDEVKRVEGQ